MATNLRYCCDRAFDAALDLIIKARNASRRFSFFRKKTSIRPHVSQAATQKYIGSLFLNSLSVLCLILSPVMSLYSAMTMSMYRVTNAGLEKQRMLKSQSAQTG